jgi:hypothetical protein
MPYYRGEKGSGSRKLIRRAVLRCVYEVALSSLDVGPFVQQERHDSRFTIRTGHHKSRLTTLQKVGGYGWSCTGRTITMRLQKRRRGYAVTIIWY